MDRPRSPPQIPRAPAPGYAQRRYNDEARPRSRVGVFYGQEFNVHMRRDDEPDRDAHITARTARLTWPAHAPLYDLVPRLQDLWIRITNNVNDTVQLKTRLQVLRGGRLDPRTTLNELIHNRWNGWEEGLYAIFAAPEDPNSIPPPNATQSRDHDLRQEGMNGDTTYSTPPPSPPPSPPTSPGSDFNYTYASDRQPTDAHDPEPASQQRIPDTRTAQDGQHQSPDAQREPCRLCAISRQHALQRNRTSQPCFRRTRTAEYEFVRISFGFTRQMQEPEYYSNSTSTGTHTSYSTNCSSYVSDNDSSTSLPPLLTVGSTTDTNTSDDDQQPARPDVGRQPPNTQINFRNDSIGELSNYDSNASTTNSTYSLSTLSDESAPNAPTAEISENTHTQRDSISTGRPHNYQAEYYRTDNPQPTPDIQTQLTRNITNLQKL